MSGEPRLKKVLVTGGCGFIGSHLTERLGRAGFSTVVLDDLSSGLEQNVGEGAKFVRGSVTDREAVTSVLAGVDAVFHLAARVSVRASLEEFRRDAEVNVMGTVNVLDCARRAGVGRFIYASSAAVYGQGEPGRASSEDSPTRPATPYGISKLAGEMYVRTICALSDLEYQVLRFFNVYGPGQRMSPYSGVITVFTGEALAGRAPTVFGDGEQVRDFIHVGDVVAAALLALESAKHGLTVNIATGRPCSVNELSRMITGAVGLEAEPVHSEAVPGETRYSLGDTRLATDELGFEAEGVLERMIADVIEWIRGRAGEAGTGCRRA